VAGGQDGVRQEQGLATLWYLDFVLLVLSESGKSLNLLPLLPLWSKPLEVFTGNSDLSFTCFYILWSIHAGIPTAPISCSHLRTFAPVGISAYYVISEQLDVFI
jgi:hypothetical protein